MSKYTTGELFIKFYNEWPPGDDWYIDGCDYTPDGGPFTFVNPDTDNELAPTDKVCLDRCGYIGWQNVSSTPPSCAPYYGEMGVEFSKAFKHWLKTVNPPKKTAVRVLVPTDRLDEFNAMFEAWVKA